MYFIQADHLNAPRIILNNANIPVWRWDHADAFGTTLPNEDPDGDGDTFEYNLRFPGQYYDQETGLHYNYFRDYDPSTGRYIASDPIGLSGGLNTYGYVGGDPVNAVDPSGLIVEINGTAPRAISDLDKAYQKVRRTNKGKQLCETLENAPDKYTITNKSNNPFLKGTRAFWSPYFKTIILDPGYHPLLNTEAGKQPSPTAINLGHELGHAATGIEDGPEPEHMMDNVNANENPIRDELGLPRRTTYP